MGRKNKSRIAWHYTYSRHINAIFKSGALLPPSELNVGIANGHPEDIRNDRGYQADEKLLLFSENDHWEPASFRAVQAFGLTFDIIKLEDYARYGIECYRIGVPTHNLKPYSQLLREVHMPKDMANDLTKVANGGNPFQWWGSTKPVPQEKWVAIQKFVGGEWIDWLPETAEKAKVSAA